MTYMMTENRKNVRLHGWSWLVIQIYISVVRVPTARGSTLVD